MCVSDPVSIVAADIGFVVLQHRGRSLLRDYQEQD